MMIYDVLLSIRKQFEYYKLLAEKSFCQVEDEALFWQYNEESNSIAIIVNHLSGNMKSRWTDFLTSDREKEWRNRELEFEANLDNREELRIAWEEGWSCLFNALDSLDHNDLYSEITIRNQTHTVKEAIHRQMMHYAYHVGQIVYIARMNVGKQWQSLSIPRGGSQDFNEDKFSRGRHGGHFTDDIQ